LAVRTTTAAGVVTGIEGIARDVSARERAAGELAAANTRLVEVSRRAGMAEVASSVLHDVGNVLNSVNVSTALLGERLRDSRVANLRRAVELLRVNGLERATFVAHEPEGQRLLTYLTGLAEHLGAEREALAREVETLARSVEHIKEIVALQQGYARAPGGTEETLAAGALVAEALRMLDEAPGAILVELADDPALTIEKHKVVQILINLLRNARQACAERTDVAGRVTVRVESGAPGRVRFAVRDDGVGLGPELMKRVFEHGFTTRKEGHGFGLHGAALMAEQLGGALEVASDGPGRGATFTLDLPLDATAAEARRRANG
jgi:two-component system NtrC family sensor kinase